MEKQSKMHLLTSLVVGLFLVMGTAMTAVAEINPEEVKRIIKKEFPGAEIKEIEEEMWQGNKVTEVEITAKDGAGYDICLSDDGKILKVEEEDGLPLIGGDLSIGLAAIGEREIYKGVGTEFEGAPFLRYVNGPFELQTYGGINAIYRFYGTSNLSVAVIGSVLMGGGYDADDSDYLQGMDEFHTMYNAGFEVESQFYGWDVGLEIAQDVSGEHNGQEAEISLSYQWMVAGFEFTPSLSMTWFSKKTVDHYYGVSAAETRADRPSYSPGASYEASAELMVQRRIFGNFTAVGITGISTFGNDIKDSPLVEKDYEISGVLGVMYTF